MLGPIGLVAVGGLFASLLIGTSWYFYAQQRLLVDFTYPLLSTTSIYLTLIFSSFVREQRQRRQIRSAFGQYLSPALVEQLAQSPEKLVLGGEEREMTILFTTSGLPRFRVRQRSEGPTTLINRFLTPLTTDPGAQGHHRQIYGRRHHGVLECAADDREHQLNCEAALTCWSGSMSSTNSASEAGGAPPISARRRRLNTGTCVVGGPFRRAFRYSVLSTCQPCSAP
jgi:adenylate cyclase